MKMLSALAALPVSALLLIGAAPDPGPAVHIANFAFQPLALTVHVGDSVTFVNDDEEPHTVTATDKSFDSAGLDTHGTWKHVFTKAGTFTYFCELHPYMKAKIVVTEAGR